MTEKIKFVKARKMECSKIMKKFASFPGKCRIFSIEIVDRKEYSHLCSIYKGRGCKFMVRDNELIEDSSSLLYGFDNTYDDYTDDDFDDDEDDFDDFDEDEFVDDDLDSDDFDEELDDYDDEDDDDFGYDDDLEYDDFDE